MTCKVCTRARLSSIFHINLPRLNFLWRDSALMTSGTFSYCTSFSAQKRHSRKRTKDTKTSGRISRGWAVRSVRDLSHGLKHKWKSVWESNTPLLYLFCALTGEFKKSLDSGGCRNYESTILYVQNLRRTNKWHGPILPQVFIFTGAFGSLASTNNNSVRLISRKYHKRTSYATLKRGSKCSKWNVYAISRVFNPV